MHFVWHSICRAASVALLAATTSPVASSMPTEAPYWRENDAAMKKMMLGMDVRPTGDADRDFVAMMVPHHEGAIEMARALLRYGHNEKVRRLAQEIIVDQQDEIAAMRLAVGERLTSSRSSSTR